MSEAKVEEELAELAYKLCDEEDWDEAQIADAAHIVAAYPRALKERDEARAEVVKQRAISHDLLIQARDEYEKKERALLSRLKAMDPQAK